MNLFDATAFEEGVVVVIDGIIESLVALNLRHFVLQKHEEALSVVVQLTQTHLQLASGHVCRLFCIKRISYSSENQHIQLVAENRQIYRTLSSTFCASEI